MDPETIEDQKSKLELEKKQVEEIAAGTTDVEPIDDTDDRSVFVKNVDFQTDEAEIREHFKDCGEIKRVTILKDKFSGNPKGMVYIEFMTKEEAIAAKRHHESLFKGR